jgi:hypothetical protein
MQRIFAVVFVLLIATAAHPSVRQIDRLATDELYGLHTCSGARADPNERRNERHGTSCCNTLAQELNSVSACREFPSREPRRSSRCASEEHRRP